jgi:hypothetical protein
MEIDFNECAAEKKKLCRQSFKWSAILTRRRQERDSVQLFMEEQNSRKSVSNLVDHSLQHCVGPTFIYCLVSATHNSFPEQFTELSICLIHRVKSANVSSETK